eukprot:TRINITY_DN5496_c0_g2_i1.p2 TRINITY_DN5496_c0_g2~~TRINITY_DN5496_c0_g2_i1.p2  ORF type:complete len:184 (-),score=37.88 TRINITY_DN5496_c0_g2_i1:30-581(-)
MMRFPDGRMMPLHSSVLRDGSVYYNNMFSSGMKESVSRVVDADPQHKYETIESVMEYLYSKNIQKPHMMGINQWLEIISIADMYQMRDLIEYSELYIIYLCCCFANDSDFEVTSILDLLKVAEQHSMSHLKTWIVGWAGRHMLSFVEESEEGRKIFVRDEDFQNRLKAYYTEVGTMVKEKYKE